MAWWTKAWAWLKANWKWVALPVGLIALALPWLGRRRDTPSLPAPTPVGMTPAQADAARAAAQAAHGQEVSSADQDLADQLARIQAARDKRKNNGGQARGALLIILLGVGVLGLAACRHVAPAVPPAPPVADPELDRLCLGCLLSCEASGEAVPCDCAEYCARAQHAARVARADLRQAQAVAGADLGEMQRRVQGVTQERDQARFETEQAKGERWDFFGWGVGAGAAVLTIVLGLVAGL